MERLKIKRHLVKQFKMIKLIIKYKLFILGFLLSAIIYTLYIKGFNSIINAYLFPILLSFIFLIYTEERQAEKYFRDELSKINKYLDIDYYINNSCYNGCQVYYDIKDFINKFKCNNDDNVYNKVKIFYDTFGLEIKSKIYLVNEEDDNNISYYVKGNVNFKIILSEINNLIK